jgi:hypothetical protein
MSALEQHKKIAAIVTVITVIVLTVLIYWRGLSGPFLLDDIANVVRFYVADFDIDQIIYALTHNRSGILGRPVSMASLVFSGILHGQEPWGYKLHNLIIHLINGFLIFWLLLKILPSMVKDISLEKVYWVAGITAALWLLHPLMVSTVLYVVQRMAQLATLFTLLALLIFIFAREQLLAQRMLRFYLLAYLTFPLCLIFALLSKENGALIPIYLLAFEFLVFRFEYPSSGVKKAVWIFLGIFAVIPLLVGSLYFFTHFSSFVDYSVRDFTMSERLMTQLHVIPFYLKLIFLPRLAEMSLFHDDAMAIQQFDLLTAILFLLFIASLALIFYCWKKAPVVAFAIAWFFISHLMESTFISLELIFEHRNYLAAVGPILALVYYLFSVPQYPKLKFVSAFLLLFWAFLTVTRVGEWRSVDMIYQIAVQEHPDSLRANIEFATMNYNEGNLGAAFAYLQHSQEVVPREAGAFFHESLFRCDTGTPVEALLEQAKQRLELYPVSVYTINSLEAILGRKRVEQCPEVALPKVLEIIAVAKQHPAIQNNDLYKGYLERLEGQAYFYTGNYEAGVERLLRAYEYTGLVSILLELVDIQIQVNRLDDAEAMIAQIQRINDASFGIETTRLEIIQEAYDQAVLDRQQAPDN